MVQLNTIEKSDLSNPIEVKNDISTHVLLIMSNLSAQKQVSRIVSCVAIAHRSSTHRTMNLWRLQVVVIIKEEMVRT